jgi:hypothetical protein
MKVEEPHKPWFILQLQETAHLQEIKAGKPAIINE